MLRSPTVLTLVLLLSQAVGRAAYADDPTPPKVKSIFAVHKSISGDGSPETPFIFEQGVKGKLAITTPEKAKLAWNITQCPQGDDPTELAPDSRSILFETRVPGRYQAIVAVQDTDALDVLFAWFEIKGSGPSPPPGPGPGPGPQPVTGKLTVLILEDVKQRVSLPPTQLIALLSPKVRDYAMTHCVLVDNSPEFKLVDKSADLSKLSADIQSAGKQANATSYPWIVLSNGKTGFSGPLPKTEAEVLTLLQKYGGL